ncbi:uncharacterized protein LOC119112691 [Pollicipes pollicipes]|uniref:uncharacterized protein LOC119112691 n=1 Tax=Pollicipes pollicipes TaxID=41117 RepID=UPI0018852EDA|nr:uncharacterized protein LOC119112691 [Pollicipes pollicipes]
MSPIAVVSTLVLMMTLSGVGLGHDAAVGTVDLQQDLFLEEEGPELDREKRQADFSDPKDDLRRECLAKSRRACCPLLQKDAVKFATCVKEYGWANRNQRELPGCPGYPRCPGFNRG